MKQIKFYLRHFQRQRTSSILCVGSLALGLFVALLTGLWCINEYSFDTFHHHPEDTYRVQYKGILNNESVSVASAFAPLGPEVLEMMPEIIEMTRFFPVDDNIRLGSLVEAVDNVYAVDSTFNKIHNYEIKYGSINDFKNKRNAIIINEDWVNRYFAGENPIGRIINYQGDREIVAVMHNVPVNSHLTVEALIRIDGVSWIKNSRWGENDGYMTYFHINQEAHISELEKKITEHAHKMFPPFKKFEIQFHLQPLLDVHLGEQCRFDRAHTRKKSLVVAFALMAIIVLVIGSINFTNLFISNSFLRAKSVGIKKANGATKSNLVTEFIFETFVYVCIAAVVGLLLVELAMPTFNSIINYQLSIDYSSPKLYVVLATLIAATTLLAGLFPAIYMTHFNPVITLRDQFRGHKTSVLQKGLLIIQFTATAVLLISVMTIKKQVTHLQQMDLGFNKENIIHVHMNNNIRKNYERIVKELKACPEIIDVTAKNSLPQNWVQGSMIALATKPDEDFIVEVCQIKSNYFDFMEMSIAEGLNPFGVNDSVNYCVINETAARQLGNDNIIGQLINVEFYGKMMVKGIVKDAYTKSLRNKVDGQVYLPSPLNRYNSVMMVKTTDKPQVAVEKLNKIWIEEVPEAPFEYGFLEEGYAIFYREEKTAGQIASWLMLIAFLISVAGLYGMARYAIKRRNKEIGIRKVNGASVAGIVVSLNATFFRWVGLSFVMACPLGWYLMNQWLKEFAIKTELSWWMFLVAGFSIFLVTMLTVGFQGIKAATQNPVKCLRYE